MSELDFQFIGIEDIRETYLCKVQGRDIIVTRVKYPRSKHEHSWFITNVRDLEYLDMIKISQSRVIKAVKDLVENE